MNLIEEYIGFDTLLNDIKRLSNPLNTLYPNNNLLRLSYSINNISLLELLVNIKSQSKFYWKSRTDTNEIVAFNRIQTSMGSIPTPYWYLSTFNSDQKSNSKIDYGIVIPEWGIIRNDTSYKIFFNFFLSDVTDILANIEAYLVKFEILDYSFYSNLTFIYKHNPEFPRWEQNINQCLKHFESGNVNKIVMARETCFKFSEPTNPELIFKNIAVQSNSSYLFYIQHEPGAAFFGDSPEELFSMTDNKIFSDALAGTRPRGVNTDDDDKFSQELLSSSKELEEHNFVVNFIKTQLNNICESINCPDIPIVKKFNTVQHLFTPISGELKTDKSYIDALSALHPTPAVSGFPQDLAIDIIQKLEPFDRGLYAGAIGIVLENSSEFAVGIRSGRFEDGKLYLYSGAGIVPGSNPQDEWDEINYKLENLKGRI